MEFSSERGSSRERVFERERELKILLDGERVSKFFFNFQLTTAYLNKLK
jgi:hypothetical protein